MIQLGIFADMQYADIESQGNRNYRDSIGKFLEIAGQFKKRNLARVLQLGDPINQDWSNLTAVAELFEKSKLPLVHVLGNHDFLVPDDKKKEVFRLLRVPPKGYYAMTLRDEDDAENVWRLIILFGGEISIFAADNDMDRKKAKSLQEKYRMPNGKLPFSWNGAVSEKQLRWLEDELTASTRRKESVVVCSHFPLFSQAKSIQSPLKFKGLLDNLGIYYAGMGVSTWNGQDILHVLDHFDCVKAFFAGHLHEGAYGVRKKVHHVTFRGMVEANPNAGAVVALTKNKIRVEGLGTEPSRELELL